MSSVNAKKGVLVFCVLQTRIIVKFSPAITYTVIILYIDETRRRF